MTVPRKVFTRGLHAGYPHAIDKRRGNFYQLCGFGMKGTVTDNRIAMQAHIQNGGETKIYTTLEEFFRHQLRGGCGELQHSLHILTRLIIQLTKYGHRWNPCKPLFESLHTAALLVDRYQ